MLNICFILTHLLSILVFIKIWRWRAWAHPGFYFSGIWLVSVISEWYLLSTGEAILVSQHLIDELNVYAAFTSLTFLLFAFIGHKHANRNIRINIVRDKKKYLSYLYLCLFVVILDFIIKGATFSFGLNRLASTGDMAHMTRIASPIDAVFSILTSPIIYFTIFAGIELVKYFTKSSQFSFSKLSIAVPFIITFINALIIGGRNPVAISIKHYLWGLGLGLSTYLITKRVKRRIIRFAFVVFVAFSLFSTMVAIQRQQVFGFSKTEVQGENKIISAFSGIMDYMSAHYWGYQLRRNDFSKGDTLQYGVCTFYGLGNLSIPFSGLMGIKGNLWEWIGVKYKPNEVYMSGVTGFYTTSTIYALLVRDFGVKGTYFAIIFLVLVTQLIFAHLFRHEHKTALSLIPIIIVLTYWSSSNFNSGMPDLQPLLIGALLFDLTQNNYSRKRNYAIKGNYYPDQICDQASTFG